jgi:hypothetical protein
VVPGRVGDEYEVGGLRVAVIDPTPRIDVDYGFVELELHASSDKGRDFNVGAIGGGGPVFVRTRSTAGADRRDQGETHATPGDTAYDLLHP